MLKMITVRIPHERRDAIKARVHALAEARNDLDYSMNRFIVEAIDAYMERTNEPDTKSSSVRATP